MKTKVEKSKKRPRTTEAKSFFDLYGLAPVHHA